MVLPLSVATLRHTLGVERAIRHADVDTEVIAVLRGIGDIEIDVYHAVITR